MLKLFGLLPQLHSTHKCSISTVYSFPLLVINIIICLHCFVGGMFNPAWSDYLPTFAGANSKTI